MPKIPRPLRLGQGPLQRAASNNGLFPTTPGYDEATGSGTPKFAAVITG